MIGKLLGGEPPPFPVHALPTPYRRMVEAVSEATQTDPGMGAATVVGVWSAAAGGCLELRLDPTWLGVPVLYIDDAPPLSEDQRIALQQIFASDERGEG